MEKESDLFILGVTGGIASGKTTVARILGDLGARIIDFDLLAREVVAPGAPALEEIVRRFGKEILLPDGGLDRKGLAAVVFRDPRKREILEGITHPRIREAYRRRVKEMAREYPRGIVLAVIPLLFETHLENLVHKVLLVYVPPAKQVERLMRRDGIGRAQAERILKAQMPIDEKLRLADFVIRNEGDMEQTRREAESLWERLIKTGGEASAPFNRPARNPLGGKDHE